MDTFENTLNQIISHINGISTNAIQYLIKFPNLVLIV